MRFWHVSAKTLVSAKIFSKIFVLEKNFAKLFIFTKFSVKKVNKTRENGRSFCKEKYNFGENSHENRLLGDLKLKR
jgi:hypothetical protein